MSVHIETKLNSDNRSWIDQIQSFDELAREEELKSKPGPGIKLGWVKGVLVPCLLSIWGVMLFLKMPWILGEAGILKSLEIIFISLIIILITTSSLSAISTNGKVKGGGLYFIISRSIGPGFGASIGILLAFANTISAAMNTLGFCTSLKSLLHTYDLDLIDSDYRFRILGVICIIIMSILCCIGMDREAEVQNALLIAIIIGIFNVIIGSFVGPKDDRDRAAGFTGLNMNTFNDNWDSKYTTDTKNNIQYSFFTIFAIFFPSVTGIQAGANISGDLKDPSASIPKGTFLSILITITSYVILIIVPGAVQLREATGNVTHYSQNIHLNCSPPERNCSYGLYHDENLMQNISLWPITIYFGCFGATISTALTALISVPKLLQRMGQDDVYPLLKYLAKGYGKSEEPYRAHVCAMFISSLLLVIGNLDDIASIITTIYLSAYALLNFCTFHVAYFKPLGWRPSYKFYNKWISLSGAIICFLVMVSIDYIMSLIVICAICVLYKAAARKRYVINWGSSKQAQKIKAVLKNVYKTNTIQYHVKNYLPNVIVLSGHPESRKNLVSFASMITKNNGVQICVNVDNQTNEQKKTFIDKGIQWLEKNRIKSLYVVFENMELDAATHMVYTCSSGILRPNIVLVGYKSDWLNCPYKDLQAFLNIFNVASTNGISIIMLRLASTERFVNQNLPVFGSDHLEEKKEIVFKTTPNKKNKQAQQKELESSITIKDDTFLFSSKIKRNNGTVDVWWLFEDGGLSLIITCILKSRKMWKDCKFRIFGVTNNVECLSREKNRLKQLLSMYRIEFDYLEVIVSNTTNPTTMTYFTSLLKRSIIQENQSNDDILYAENLAKTLFLRDLIELHSLKSDLVILSTPKTNEEINIIFMCWIETISRGLPPCVIINGSSELVLSANA